MPDECRTGLNGRDQSSQASENEQMRFWPFKRAAQDAPRSSEYDSVVSESNTLAKVALMPIVNRFPDYGSIIDSNLEEVWDLLMTIAMTGVAVHAESMLSNPHVRADIKRALSKQWQINAELFDEYYEFTKGRTQETKAPWCGVSALWVADKLRLHGKATTELKKCRKTRFCKSPFCLYECIFWK